VKHFNLHQFGVMTHDECETMVHDIQGMLNLHLDWAVLQVGVCNAFNLVSWSTIFQELQLGPIFWIIFSHLSDNFTHTHLQCIFLRFFKMEIS
jgi:hypothetical protein